MNKINYKGWKESLNQYKNELKKELAEVRKAKQELYDMQRQLQEMVYKGRYERDEDTLILSAPNIIIGNVDKHGNLLMGGSHVVIRSNDIALEGVGQSDGNTVTGGAVVTRARTVKVQTVDPGPDGLESVAFSDSSFTVQSAAVGIVAEKLEERAATEKDNGGVFTLSAPKAQGSISLAAEGQINALAACATHNEGMKNAAETLKNDADNYLSSAETAITEVETETKELDKVQNNKLLDLLGAASDEADVMALRSGLYKFDERSDASVEASNKMAKSIIDFTSNMSNYAEAMRINGYLTKRNTRLETAKTSYATTPTNSSINLNSEVINIATTGADGKLRTTPNNGVNINTQNTCIMAVEGTKPVEGSTFILKNDDVSIDTAKYEYAMEDKKLVAKSCTAAGSLVINGGKIDIQTMDKEFEGSGENFKVKSEKINAESIVKINTNHINFDMTDSEGKAQGSFKVNAKEIALTAYDVDKEKGTPTAITDGGSINIGSKTIGIGSPDDKLICESMQIAGKNTAIFGNDSVCLLQESGNSQLILTDSAELSSKEVKLVGDITLGGATKIDAKFTAGDIECKNLTASTSIVGPNIKDGIALSVAAPAAQASKGTERTKQEPTQSKVPSETSSLWTRILGKMS